MNRYFSRYQGRRHGSHLPFVILLFLLLLGGWNPVSAAGMDQDGNPIPGGVPFKRIISLYSAHTDNLLAFGLGPELIGVAAGDENEAVSDLPRFSANDTPEKFIAAAPDLILIRPMISQAHPQLVDQLRKAGIAVVSLQPTTVDDMFAYWQTLGELSGRAGEAAAMIGKFKGELAAIERVRDAIAMDKRPKVYFESIHARMKTFAPSSIAVFVLESAGGVNVAADAEARNATNIAAYGKERILSHAAEIDIYLAQNGRMNQVTKELIAQEPGFQAIKAIRAGRICLIDEELVSRPTPHLLQGIREVRALLYP